LPITLYAVASRGPSRRLSAVLLLMLVAAEIAVSLVNPVTLGEVGKPAGASGDLRPIPRAER
jgi:hypothetical protein